MDEVSHVAKEGKSPHRGRVRTGCLTCRSKKVKCDEHRPECRRCTRLGRRCFYRLNAPRPLAWIDGIDWQLPADSLGSPTWPTQTPSPGQHDNQYLQVDSPVGNLVDRHDEARSRHLCLEDGTIHSSQPITLRHASSSPSEAIFVESAAAIAFMTSQDIHLCTTIDLLAAIGIHTSEPFSFFLKKVQPPILASVDERNWARMKMHISGLGMQNTAVAAALFALQSLYQLELSGLPTFKALKLYNAAKDVLQQVLASDDGATNETVLVVAFLLVLFEMLALEETGSALHDIDGALATRLEELFQTESLSMVSLRIVAWLQLVHAAARRGGNPGIFSMRIGSILSRRGEEVADAAAQPIDCSIAVSEYDILRASLFSFYYQVEVISSKVANLSHYHRSRTTSQDQEEVRELMQDLKLQLYSLWEERSGVMKVTPNDLRLEHSDQIASRLVSLRGICTATYHAEIVEVGRTLSDPPLASSEAKRSLQQIRDIVEGEWSVSSPSGEGKLNAGYLRPLFLYAIESIHPDDTQWAVGRMRQINDPICRSGFFASFAEGLAEAQRQKGRRVTTKFFCLQNYGVAPPLL